MQRAFSSLGTENINLDSANIQFSNALLLDLSLRKRAEKCISLLSLVSDITFIKVECLFTWGGCLCWLVCVQMCVLAISQEYLAQGQRQAGSPCNWTRDLARLLVTCLALSRTFYRCWINTTCSNESSSVIQMNLSKKVLNHFSFYHVFMFKQKKIYIYLKKVLMHKLESNIHKLTFKFYGTLEFW